MPRIRAIEQRDGRKIGEEKIEVGDGEFRVVKVVQKRYGTQAQCSGDRSARRFIVVDRTYPVTTAPPTTTARA